jgi:nucleoside-diphosphate-sugar epimerase
MLIELRALFGTVSEVSDVENAVGVTGASGYLGGEIVRWLENSSIPVVEFTRSGGSDSGQATSRRFVLDAAQTPVDLAGISCLVHAAWDLRTVDPQEAWETNVEGSKRLLEAASKAGVQRVIFISSMSAYWGTKQKYGLMKLAVERLILEASHVVVRPGLVLGRGAGGMGGTLRRLSGLPLVPTFSAGRQFLVDIDDLIDAVGRLITMSEHITGVIGCANGTSVTFSTIMRSLSLGRQRDVRLVRIPWRPLFLCLRIAEKLGIDLQVRSDSLLGLVRPAPVVPGRELAERFGIHFRPPLGDAPGSSPLRTRS